MNKLLALLGLFAVISTAYCIQWKDCGSKQGKVTKVSVEGCETASECPLKKGTNVSFEVDFSTKEQVTKATAVVHGVIAGVPIPFKIPNADGCKNSNLACPLASGSSNQYKTSIYVDPSYPKVRLVVKWELQDQNSNDIFCIELPAAIVDSTSSSSSNTLRFRPHA